jgi:DNA polymerase-1
MIVAFDCETHLIAPGKLAPPCVCVTIATDAGDLAILHARDPETPSTLAAMFEGAECIAGANTAYDAAVVCAAWPELVPAVFGAYAEGRVLDVQINEQLADIARGRLYGFANHEGKQIKIGYSLADLVRRYLGRDRSAEKDDPNGWRLRYAELEHVPLAAWPVEATRYALDDAADTLAVLEAQAADARVWGADAEAQARASFALHLLSVHGVHTHAAGIEALERMTRANYERASETLRAAGVLRANGTRDTKAAKARMVAACSARGVPVPLTDKGRETAKANGGVTPGEALAFACLDAEACAASGDPVLEAYGERVTLAAVVETHLPKLAKGIEHPIQARFNVLVESGRISCSEGRGATNGYQLTNVRRLPGIRECFKARPGFVFIDADFAGLELHTVAQACLALVGWSDLAAALNAKIDPHLALGAELIGLTYPEAVERKHEKAIKEARQIAKVANFGFPGGLGARGFVEYATGYGLAITEERAAEVRRAWLTRWTEFSAYFDHVRRLCEPLGVAEVVQLYSGRVRGMVPYTAACNTYFQGLGADGAKAALWEVTRRAYADPASILFGVRPWNFVHDQILAEAPIETAPEQAIELARVMVEACNRFLPDVPVRCEPCLSFVWSKDAEPVYSDGRLVPWDAARDARAVVYYADGKRVQW